MPYKSQKQRAFFYSQLPQLAEEWEAHTPKKKLPSRVTKKRKVVKKKIRSTKPKKVTSSKQKKKRTIRKKR